MLQITPDTLIFLRSVQAASDEKQRRRRAAVVAYAKPREMNAGRFARLVQQVTDILKTGRSSKFEFEAACRHGVRRSLCLEGWKWSDADASANAVVGSALKQIGAERPTWAQGQPGWTEDGFSPVERTRCPRCHGKLPEGRSDRIYCSELCREAAKGRRAYIMEVQVSAAELKAANAAQAARSRKEREKDCENCGKAFITPAGDLHRRFCSRPCASKTNSATRRNKPDRTCMQCGKLYRPQSHGSKFCSSTCMGQAFAISMAKPPQPCKHCGVEFRPTRRGVLFCSNDCRSAARIVSVTKPCVRCGTPFTRTGHAAVRNKTCSPACSAALSADARRKALPELSCQACKAIFRPQWATQQRLYCSKRCSSMVNMGAARMAALSNKLGLGCDQIGPTKEAGQ